jgi:hypothetical protein
MEWQFLIDPFLVIALKSRKRAIEISAYTYNALQTRQADPFFGPRWLIYKPLHEALVLEESQWGFQKGFQKGKTITLDSLLAQLSPGKINEWEYQIRGVYAVGSAEYMTLLPNGIGVFGEGKKTDIIERVRVLNLALTGIAPLAATKTDVDNFYTALNTARNTQQGEITDTKDESGDVTLALQTAMIGLYSFLGACIEHFAATPLDIKPLFHIQLIRDLPQTLFIRTVGAGLDITEFVAKRTTDPNAKVKFKITTPGAVRIGATEEKNDPLGAGGQLLNGLEDNIYTVSQLQLTPASTYFKISNADPSIEAHCEIEFL